MARYSRTFLVRNSEFFFFFFLKKRKHVDRARVDNKVDRKDVYAACDLKQRL